MSDKCERFECVMEPAGTWMVWDMHLEIPAELAQAALMGMERASALLICKLLNTLHARAQCRLLAS